MASDLQLALDFVVNDLGSQKFTEIANKAQAAGLDIKKSFEEATKAGEKHERSLGKAASAVEHLGSKFTEQLGPAGGIVENLTRELGGLSGSLEDVIAQTGLSSGALLGLAGGAIVVGGLASAFEKAAEQAERIDAAIIKAAASTKNYAASKRLIEERASRDSSTTGIPQEQIAAAAGSALGAFGNQANALEFLKGPETLAVAQLGKLDDLVARSIPLFKGYGLEVSRSQQIFAELAVTARETDEPIEQLIATMAEGAPIAHRLGLSFEDSLSLIGAAGKEGAAPDEVRNALQRLLGVISDADNDAHKRLAALGVNFNQDLSGVIESINGTIEANGGGKLFEQLFPAGRGQSAISALLKSSRADIASLKLDYVGAVKEMRALANEVGNEPGAQLARASEQIRNSVASIGKDFEAGKSKFFGSPLELPVEITLPDNLTSLVSKIRDEVVVGNIEAARSDLEKLHELGDHAGQLYSDSYAKAVKDRQEQLARELRRIVPGKRDPSTFKVDSIPGLDEKSFVEQAHNAVLLVDDLVRKASIQLPIDVKPSENLPATLDLLQSDIERAIRSFDLTPIEFRAKVLPPDVEQAQKALDEIEKSLANPDGTRKSTAALGDADKQRARDSVQTILTYYQQVVAVQRISLGIDSQTGGALDKQVAQHQAVLQSIRDALTELKLQPDQLDKVRAKRPGLAADFERIEQLSTKQAGLGFQASSLAAREKALTTARELARVQGDVAAADDLDRQIIETKAREQRTAILQQQVADNIQAGNDADTLRRIQERTDAQLREVNAAEKLAGINADRSIDSRQLQVSVAVSNLQKELLAGLDSEIAGIEGTIAARRRAVIEAKNVASEELAQLGVLDQIHDKLIDIAQRNADLSQVDAISNILGNITDSYSSQVESIDRARAAEKLRFDESLRNANTEVGLRRQLLNAFDDETRARQRSAAIGFAGRSAADIAHENLLTDAYERARRGAEALGLTREETLQAEVDAVSRATDGADAWRDGWTSGIEDALRQMDRFNTAVAAGGELANGFRDSIVNALGEIGQAGKNPLKDFLISNLQGIEKIAATSFANFATRGLGKALGVNLPNQADVLAPGAAALSSAGIELITAAGALQAAAFTLGSGIGGSFVSSFFGSNALSIAGGLDPIGTVGVPGATGGEVYGFANGGIGRNGRKRTSSKDTIPALLSPGEYVMRPEAVSALGVGYLDDLNNGRVPSSGSSRARQRVADSTQARVVQVHGPSIGDIHIAVHVTGEAANDPQAIARAVRDQVVPAVTAALESGSSRRLIEAVRGASR